ncbi:Hypothetical predicted protein [Lecanosticta acicola]|uniref:Uncharacterized protein n=1 Tax=Lecanosticta acicola TaxID=111012 RepID=A0AAI8YYR5_9PEZI|nr:Hypothetical predicted protein [Lecanosticta acicola]
MDFLLLLLDSMRITTVSLTLEGLYHGGRLRSYLRIISLVSSRYTTLDGPRTRDGIRGRKEACKIFYAEDEFLFHAPGYNADTLHTFATHVHDQGILTEELRSYCSCSSIENQRPSWAGLCEWLLKKHQIPHYPGLLVPQGLKEKSPHATEKFIVGGMFSTA